MKLQDLKKALKARNLVISRIKSVFFAWLEISVENGMATDENMYPNIIEKNSGKGFQ